MAMPCAHTRGGRRCTELPWPPTQHLHINVSTRDDKIAGIVRDSLEKSRSGAGTPCQNAAAVLRPPRARYEVFGSVHLSDWSYQQGHCFAVQLVSFGVSMRCEFLFYFFSSQEVWGHAGRALAGPETGMGVVGADQCTPQRLSCT